MGTTNSGKSELSGLAGDVGSKTAFTYLAVGTGTTAFAASQTSLASEITDTGLARASATVTQETSSVSDDTLQLQHTWTATGSKTLGEIGVLNASSGGTMGWRQALSPTKSLTSGSDYTATMQIAFS